MVLVAVRTLWTEMGSFFLPGLSTASFSCCALGCQFPDQANLIFPQSVVGIA